MPRKKTLTPEEIIAAGQELSRRMKYFSEHPEENAKRLERMGEMEERRTAKNMKKHQPQVTDIADNGQYVSVAFTLNNGERVVGCYKRLYWDLAPQKRANAAWKRRIDYWNPLASKDEAAAPPPPKPGKTPRS